MPNNASARGLSLSNGSARAEPLLLAGRGRPAVKLLMVTANLVEVAALVGDTARATMLAALMGGQSLTATELAFLARISRSTASGHLAKLVNARLLVVTRQRRFAYYRIASPLVAQMLESIKQVAAIEVPPRHRPRSPEQDALLFARTCYDHLAGRVGVALADALVARGHIILTDEAGEVTPSGERFLCSFGVDLAPRGRRRFCQPCLDWSERRYHLRGVVGAGLLHRCFDLGWFKRERDTRALKLTSAGRAGLASMFGVEFGDAAQPAVATGGPKALVRA
jgi:DNA-binding transcriptional ArsR family regulator